MWKRDRCKPVGLPSDRVRRKGMMSKQSLDDLEDLINERLRRKKKPAKEEVVSE